MNLSAEIRRNNTKVIWFVVLFFIFTAWLRWVLS